MPLRKWIKSANYAIEGILWAAKTQRHMRYHLYAAVLLLLTGFILGISWSDFVILITLSIIVISIEMINTALETITDILFKEYDNRAKIIKDIAAGAVLISSLGAALIGYVILSKPVEKFFESGLIIAKHSKGDIAVVALVVVLIMVVITKTLFERGKPLKGGMPSGHAAVAFSMWMTVTMMTESYIPSLLAFAMATLIAQSRVYVGIHKPLEVIMGGTLGTSITYLLFWVFS